MVLCLAFCRSLRSGAVRSHCKYHRKLQDRCLFLTSISNKGRCILPRRNERQTQRPAGGNTSLLTRCGCRLVSRGYCAAQALTSILEHRHPYSFDRHGKPLCCSGLQIPAILRPSPGVSPPEQRTGNFEHTLAGSTSIGSGSRVGSMICTPWIAAL